MSMIYLHIFFATSFHEYDINVYKYKFLNKVICIWLALQRNGILHVHTNNEKRKDKIENKDVNSLVALGHTKVCFS